MKKTLDGLQLKDWAKYEKQIQCSTDFENEAHDPAELIYDETLLLFVEPIWKKAFGSLPKYLLISELPGKKRFFNRAIT